MTTQQATKKKDFGLIASNGSSSSQAAFLARGNRKSQAADQQKADPPPGTRIAKDAVGYTYRPETQVTCDVCVFSKDSRYPNETKRCKFLGPNVDIKSYGSCILFTHMDPTKEGTPEVPMLNVYTPEEVGYAENKMGFTCKRCIHFDADSNDCYVVDKDSPGDTPGMIHANACCNNWWADPVRAQMTTEQVLDFLNKNKAR